jgi:hypothetical protein
MASVTGDCFCGLFSIVFKVSDCIIHTKIFNIVQVPKMQTSRLMLKFREFQKLFDVMTQYEFKEIADLFS